MIKDLVKQLPKNSALERNLKELKPKHDHDQRRKKSRDPIDEGKVEYTFIFQNPNYREIVHVQSFCIESWIGNAGGYIGLFLGVALWQIPEFIAFLWKKFTDVVTF
jgi:hypothetical protein